MLKSGSLVFLKRVRQAERWRVLCVFLKKVEQYLPCQFFHQLHRLHAHRYHLADQSRDVLLVVEAVGIARDAAAFVRADLVLINDPFQSRAVAQAIAGAFRRNA